jgi:glycogen synthase
MEVFRDKVSMQLLSLRGMNADFSWNRSAPLYKKLYESLLL